MAMANAKPTWMSRLNTENKKFRTENRLSSFANYVIPSSLIYLIAQIDRPSNELPPRSFTRPLKIAFLLLHIFGLLWIIAATWRTPTASVFLFVCLTIASFKFSLPWIVGHCPNAIRYLTLFPRGSAVLLLLRLA
jgi:hypothetical protein